MYKDPEHEHMANLAKELDLALRGLSYPEYLEQVHVLLGSLLEYYRPELPKNIATLAEQTLHLLDPSTTVQEAELDQIDQAWEIVKREFYYPSHHIKHFCSTLSSVKLQLSGRNYLMGSELSSVLIADMFRPMLPSEAHLQIWSFPIPREQADKDLRMMNRLLAHVRQRGDA